MFRWIREFFCVETDEARIAREARARAVASRVSGYDPPNWGITPPYGPDGSPRVETDDGRIAREATEKAAASTVSGYDPPNWGITPPYGPDVVAPQSERDEQCDVCTYNGEVLHCRIVLLNGTDDIHLSIRLYQDGRATDRVIYLVCRQFESMLSQPGDMVTLSTRCDFDFTVEQTPKRALLNSFDIDWQHRVALLNKRTIWLTEGTDC